MAELPDDRLSAAEFALLLHRRFGATGLTAAECVAVAIEQVDRAYRSYQDMLTDWAASNFLTPDNRRRLGQINHSRAYLGRPPLHWTRLRPRRPLP